MSAVYICIGGRCSTWGRNWKRHLYKGEKQCMRCGIYRAEAD